jgi:hypothetical protein
MQEKRCNARLVLRSGAAYMVFESLEELRSQDGEWISALSWTGADLMPPERLCVLRSDVTTLQELSEPDWVWAKHATELHYARQLQELETSQTSQFKRLVDVLAQELSE